MSNSTDFLSFALFLWSCRTIKTPEWVFRGIRHFLFAFLVTVTLVSPTLVSVATVTNIRPLDFFDFGKIGFFSLFILIPPLFSFTLLTFLFFSPLWSSVVPVDRQSVGGGEG